MSRITSLQARDQFARARRKAALQQAFAALTGKSLKLLPYDDVREKLKFLGSAYRGLEEIPLDAIVGSVGRYQDFTRTFLPTNPQDAERWANLRMYIAEREIPAIEVYKVGEMYFVIDGNHRVSVARELKMAYITAQVTEIKTRVPLSEGDTPRKLIDKACYAQFLEQTDLDNLRPGSNLLMTMCDQYDLLLSQIEVNRYFLWLEQQIEHPYAEVVADWYDQTYLPVVEVIRQQGLIAHFAERTETDLYVLLTAHRLELEKALGLDIDTPQAADDLKRGKKSPRKVKLPKTNV
jgi:hypothetical protein